MALRSALGHSSLAVKPHTRTMRVAPMLRAGVSRKACVSPVAILDNKNNNKDVVDRVAATVPYLLPLLDALPYGKFLFAQYPFIARGFAPLLPLYQLYTSFPFAPFLVFLGVYSLIVNNYSFGRFVRYNAMQAVLVDILLVFPQLLLGVGGAPRDDFSFTIYMQVNNTIFLYVALCCAFGMGSALVGQTARLPLVASAADSQVRGGPGGM